MSLTHETVPLDVPCRGPYLSPAMNRFVLTLLALLTGLAAQVSPAQAVAVRAGGEAEVGSVEAVRAVRLAQQVAVGTAEKAVGHDARAVVCRNLPYRAVPAPAVRIGIDRARE